MYSGKNLTYDKLTDDWTGGGISMRHGVTLVWLTTRQVIGNGNAVNSVKLA